jgi:hypothetical protein
MKEKGMKIYAPTPEEKAQFMELTQKPVIEFLKEDFKKKGVSLEWFPEFYAAVAAAEKKLGYQ